MAELAASAFAAMTTTAATAGATAGAAATSATLTAVQGVATALSMASLVIGGLSAARDGRVQAAFANVDAEQQRLAGEERANQIRRELVQRTADARVAFAGAGLSIASGSEVEASLAGQADFEERMARASARMGRASGQAQAVSYRSRGAGALVGSLASAASRYADYRVDLARRG